MALLVGGAAWLGACASEEAPESDADALSPLDATLNVTGRGRDEAYKAPAAGEILVQLTQPELLVKLESQGYHVTQLFGGTGRMSNQALNSSSALYRSLVQSVTSDVDAAATAAQFVVTARDDIPRRFDMRWLTSPLATFDLAGVVFRPDKADAAPSSCGEVRFVHHLRYAKAMPGGRVAASRLPFLLNAVFDVPRDADGSCVAAVEQWRASAAMATESTAISTLVAGPLSLTRLSFKQLELNAQVVRMTAASRPTTGGQAEYFLRVFKKAAGAFVPTPLENTPDVAALRADPARKAALLAWIRANVAGIDAGTAQVPAEFLATRGTSFTTLGSAKLAKKLFSQLYTPAELAGLSFASTKLVASPQALLARLDDMTCAGCHQGRSVAGFHFLGVERGTLTHPMNALHTAFSPHYLAEIPRRQAFAQALATRATPVAYHALSGAPAPGATATMGTECVPDASRALFKTGSLWSCAAGQTCTVAVTNDRAPLNMGQCLPPNRAGNNDMAGLPCFGGEILDSASGPRCDSLQNPPDPVSCGARTNCAMPKGGSPGGMCLHRLCTSVGTELVPGEICGYGGANFDACAARGDFGACIADSVSLQGRRACDDENPCREDYVCQRLEDPRTGNFSTTPSRNKGYCTPIYFVFQMRIDGHISP